MLSHRPSRKEGREKRKEGRKGGRTTSWGWLWMITPAVSTHPVSTRKREKIKQASGWAGRRNETAGGREETDRSIDLRVCVCVCVCGCLNQVNGRRGFQSWLLNYFVLACSQGGRPHMHAD
mmetsp:Transcript_32068/g.63571  ORF Transcript_32068/g.63571 Transcript_32068/m.63571 type:complete len:121 (-) Transcript_32068:182-544(-)